MTEENTQHIDHSNENRWFDGLGAVALVVVIALAASWVGQALSTGDIKMWHVLVAASITAVTTGLGALPFLFINELSNHWLGIGNALAAGLMLGASVGLIVEGVAVEDVSQPILRLLVGGVLGVGLVLLARRFLADRDEGFVIGHAQGANAIQMLLIVGVMTAHSFAEGIGVGVSYGDSDSFGALISVAIAIHNIPEGLAISLILIPRGTSVLRAARWSIFSSLPQPIMAVPAYLFVLTFRPLLPVGLGLAAGAMIWMVFRELLPEANERLPRRLLYPVVGVAVVGMLLFQALLGG